jgi:hypothetical protein
MTLRQAPEIFQIPLADLDPAGLPPRGTAEFEQAVVGRYALDYAARGWQAVVAVDDAFVRVVAVPERGVEPKAYVLGLLHSLGVSCATSAAGCWPTRWRTSTR